MQKMLGLIKMSRLAYKKKKKGFLFGGVGGRCVCVGGGGQSWKNNQCTASKAQSEEKKKIDVLHPI